MALVKIGRNHIFSIGKSLMSQVDRNCDQCDKPVNSNFEFIKALGNVYHKDCYLESRKAPKK